MLTLPLNNTAVAPRANDLKNVEADSAVTAAEDFARDLLSKAISLTRPVSGQKGSGDQGSDSRQEGAFTPPDPAVSSVPEMAAAALQTILFKLDSSASVAGPASSAGLISFAKEDLSHIMAGATALMLKITGDRADAKSKSVSLMTDYQIRVRDMKTQEYQEKIDKAIEDANKGRKAGIFGVVFDWVIASVEVVTGVAKVLTGNPQGVVDIMAGCAGFAKAALNTMAMLDPENAEKYRKAAEIIGYVQMALEIIGGVSEIAMMARAAVATKCIATTTATVMEQGGAVAIKEAVEQAGTHGMQAAGQAVGRAAETVAEQVANQVIDQVQRNISKLVTTAASQSQSLVGNAIAKFGFENLAQNLSKEMIKKIVKGSVERVAMEAAEEVAKSGKAVVAKEIGETITTQVQREVTGVIRRSFTPIVQGLRYAAEPAKNLGLSVMALKRAELLAEIKKILTNMEWLDQVFQWAEKNKEAAKKLMENQLKEHATALEGGNDRMAQYATTMASVAGKRA